MGLLSDLASGGIKGIVGGVADAVDRFVETPDEKAAIELKRAALDAEAQMRQMAVNQQEAAHRSVFVAGWRPAIGWCGAAAIAYAYVVQPLMVYGMALWAPHLLAPPPIDLSGLYPIILGMLGLGGLRTLEKAKGVTK